MALVVIVLLGHWMEMRALGQARGALSVLSELLPDEAERIRGDDVERVPVPALAEGDVLLVRPGGRVPADGDLLSDLADLDESMITGESRPVERRAGETVVAGTVAAGSSLRLRVSAIGEGTRLAGIQRLVSEAETSRSRTQALADRAVGILFYVATGTAALTFVVWLTVVGDPDEAVTRTVTVLVISCPHALGLAIPFVIALATSFSARQGILVRDRLALERMRRVDTVLFDKTGTLTRGELALTAVAALDGDEDRALALAAAAEAESEHPAARAIHAAARERGEIPLGADFRSMAGRGVEATVQGRRVAVGGPVLLLERNLEVPVELAERGEELGWRGASVLHVVSGGEVLAALALEDQPRSGSRETIERLHKRGVRVVMITGDARQVADAVADDLGIDEVFAEVLPEDKDAKVRVLRLSLAGYRKMLQNLAWALGYNIVALPIAAGVAAPIGLSIPPGAAAILMSISTVVVVLNAELLRRLDLRTDRQGAQATRAA